jgi:hypothetical protein
MDSNTKHSAKENKTVWSNKKQTGNIDIKNRSKSINNLHLVWVLSIGSRPPIVAQRKSTIEVVAPIRRNKD